MTTLTSTHSHYSSREQSMTLASRYNLFIKNLEFSHFGFIAMAILISTCLGSIATMQVFVNQAPLWEFIICLGFTMANLVACIAQAPTKWAFNIFAASMIVNAAVLIVNII
ncbi:MAG: hypothetical protein ACXVPQ_02380 [Bacteroidia bacterium]